MEREHLHKILDAWLDGEVIQGTHKGDENWTDQRYYSELILDKEKNYRIKPKQTPLPIPYWFWSGIDKQFTKAVLNHELDTITFLPKYVTPHIENGQWITDKDPYYTFVNPALIGVSLKDIDWRLSLTKRPEGL